jgi:hypothetical protein
MCPFWAQTAFGSVRSKYHARVGWWQPSRRSHKSASFIAIGACGISIAESYAVRGLPQVRQTRRRLSSGQVRRLSGREACRVQLQAPRLLSELRCPANGRDGGVARGRRAPSAADPPMGAVTAFALRYLLATRPEVVTQVLGLEWGAVAKCAGFALDHGVAHINGCVDQSCFSTRSLRNRVLFPAPAGRAEAPPRWSRSLRDIRRRRRELDVRTTCE